MTMVTLIILILLASLIVIPLFCFVVSIVAAPLSFLVAPILHFFYQLWEVMKKHKVISAIVIIILLLIAF